MKDREVAREDGWIPVSPLTRKLAALGYSVGGYSDNGVARYVLYRVSTGNHFERVHEFDTPEEMNNMVKLLIPPENEG